jgi:Zinc finger, C3HC4 type (RING finger)
MTVPFSLHCSICIEAFDATERPPVVLPCGHTFLCLQCSKRLKSCMECRTPLFVSRRLPQGPPATVAHRGNSYSRTAHYSGPASPPLRVQGNPTRTTQEAPEALPIPKNLVLLALIEASANLTGVTEDPDKDYESGDDNEQVLEGIDMMATCGTFVVKAKEGLVIDPEHCSDSSIFSTNDKENQEEQLMMKVEIGESSKTFVDEHLLELSICRTHSEEVEVPMFFPNPPASEMAENRLSYGQTCQVVAFQGGTAKLARDLGYIQAKNDELVKSKLRF